MGWLLDDHTIDWAIRNFTAEWYIEYKDARPAIIDAFYRPNGPAIGHFTLLVNDKQSKGAKLPNDNNNYFEIILISFYSQSVVVSSSSQNEWITTTIKFTF